MRLPWHQHAEDWPDAPALIHQHEVISWAQLSSRVGAVASMLEQQGVHRSDVVCLLGHNSLEALLVYLANIQLGAISAWLMPEPGVVTLDKCQQVYRQGEPVRIFCSDSDWQVLVQEGSRTSVSLLNRIVISEPLLGSDFGENQRLNNQLKVSPKLQPNRFNPQQLVSIVFTSGSTGQPKAVAHQYAQHQASAEGLLAQFDYTRDDSWLLSLPMFHVSGLAIVHRWLTRGAGLKLGSGELIADIGGVTHASLVPTQLKRLLESGQDLALKRVLLGGAHIPHELAKQAQQLGIDTWLGYGMTEMASTVTAKRVDGQPGVGTLLANRDLMLDEQQILVKGATLACGYYSQGELHPLVDKSGWFHTNDLGRFVAGELNIDGRADNCFISGGENIHCEEIELATNRHPDVVQCVVVPIEDAQFGARPLLLVETRTPFAAQEIQAFLAQELVKFKVPKRIEALPSSLLGEGIKLSRYQVKRWVSSHFTELKVIF
ncbi:o-succinylbenzoate--CoA ligase [Vibrio sp. WXL210]|uniref:o-succinylbenzoate--CoA ligase n=1 Tax=Vibrio sp. WXL210 TaxID=3450709 RepID=UPI003EC5F184